MRFFVNIIAALLVGCLSTANADQTKPELDELFDALRIRNYRNLNPRIWSTGTSCQGTLCRCSLSLIEAFRLSRPGGFQDAVG